MVIKIFPLHTLQPILLLWIHFSHLLPNPGKKKKIKHKVFPSGWDLLYFQFWFCFLLNQEVCFRTWLTSIMSTSKLNLPFLDKRNEDSLRMADSWAAAVRVHHEPEIYICIFFPKKEQYSKMKRACQKYTEANLNEFPQAKYKIICAWDREKIEAH